MENIKNMPIVGQLVSVIDRYPRISAWIVLSAGIIALLVYEAQDVDLTTSNWLALIVASIAISGLCIWIVSWEDEEVEEESAASVTVKSEKKTIVEEVPSTAETVPGETLQAENEEATKSDE